jgi:hypothetical protein
MPIQICVDSYRLQISSAGTRLTASGTDGIDVEVDEKIVRSCNFEPSSDPQSFTSYVNNEEELCVVMPHLNFMLLANALTTATPIRIQWSEAGDYYHVQAEAEKD